MLVFQGFQGLGGAEVKVGAEPWPYRCLGMVENCSYIQNNIRFVYAAMMVCICSAHILAAGSEVFLGFCSNPKLASLTPNPKPQTPNPRP